jgi:putative colanic acid biosynthesis acetyltransferase WcaF
MASSRNLLQFTSPKLNLRSKIRIAIWFGFQNLIFNSALFPSGLRPVFLRFFGASVGRKVLIRRGARVHFPWNLEIGDNCWIGEEVWFINHEKITLGSDVCISQRSIICSGGHDYQSISLEYSHKPIVIKNGAWVCLDAKILPGVSIGECSVVSAGEIVRTTLPDYSMLIDGTIRSIDLPK